MLVKRSGIQIMSAVLSNAYIPGFIQGGIYQGGVKKACVPFLNCYSCPGAVGACPVGSVQSLAVSTQRISLYVTGIVLAAGALGGRLVCGWLCPFGLFQEIMFKITRFKLQIYRSLLNLKYLVLFLTLMLPLLLIDPVTGIAAPYFCKYLCPAGTLEAGIPLLLLNTSLRGLIGGLFIWKLAVLLVFIVSMLFIWRPFCRIICPLGAFYALLNRVSVFQLHVDQEACSRCGICQSACPAGIPVQEEPGSAECVRCLDCLDACPNGALSWQTSLGTGNPKAEDAEIEV